MERLVDAKAVLRESLEAMEALRRLTMKLEVWTDRLERELDRSEEEVTRRDDGG